MRTRGKHASINEGVLRDSLKSGGWGYKRNSKNRTGFCPASLGFAGKLRVLRAWPAPASLQVSLSRSCCKVLGMGTLQSYLQLATQMPVALAHSPQDSGMSHLVPSLLCNIIAGLSRDCIF